ncbi:hypothetical protein SDC9_19570 [bioreactor metagenome]|uniref:NAD-specific glutamate dehydrogenase n=1 Tax=bioreactor metagenome TaxID=1076179 RepID=A0A644U4B7_9ZZZZ
MVEHHLVGLATDARLLVAAEGRMGRIGVIVVDPDAPGLDVAAEAVAGVDVARPDAGAKAIHRVIGDMQRFRLVLEGGHRNDRPEDFLLEHAHLVVALEDRRLDVEAVRELAIEARRVAAHQHLGAFLAADLQVGQDLVLLFLARLGADHGLHQARVALLDRLDPGDGALDEGLVDVFLDQRARRAGADLALIEGKQNEAFDRLVEEGVILRHHVREEDVRRLAAQFQRDRDQVLGRGLHDLAAGRGRAGEGDLGDARRFRQRRADFRAHAVDDVQHAARQQVGDEFRQHHDRGRGLFGGLHHHAVAGGQRRGEFPRRHQDREVPRDDLADDAERLVIVIGDGVVVDFRHRAFLAAQDTGEVAEMVDRQRDVGGGRLADRLAVVPGLGGGEQVEVRLEPVGDLQQHVRAVRGRGGAPAILGGMGSVERQLDIGSVRTGDFANLAAGDRGDVVEILAADRRHELAADEVIVARLERRHHHALELGRHVGCHLDFLPECCGSSTTRDAIRVRQLSGVA